MQDAIVFEIAIADVPRIDSHQGRPDCYWTIRWVENGAQVDQVHLFNSLSRMEWRARRFMEYGDLVVWRYYVAGLDTAARAARSGE